MVYGLLFMHIFFLLTSFIHCSEKEHDPIRTTFFGCLNEYINLYGDCALLGENDFAQKKPDPEDFNFFTIEAIETSGSLNYIKKSKFLFIGSCQAADKEKYNKESIKVKKHSTMRDICEFLGSVTLNHYDNDIKDKWKFASKTNKVRNCLSKKSQHNDIRDFLCAPDTETYKKQFNERIFQAQRENKVILGIQTFLFLALSITYWARGWHTQFWIKRHLVFVGVETLLAYYIKKDCNAIMIMSQYMN